ncbi:MAG: N-acetylglucosamine-6-phosphate deacetylase [Thalassotalea sp.]|nr:N-acetylglucosamine-6-phosphate deacetylase [Thalassotalea sp.]
MVTTLIADYLFDGQQLLENQPISFDGNEIVALDVIEGADVQIFEGILVPGFIDVQVNGGGGVLFNHDTSLQTLEKMVQAHAKFGSTSLLPTLITSDINTLHQASNTISKAILAETPGIIGVHFEGPHLSTVKKGIHSSSHIRKLSDEELAIYCRNDLGIKIVTLAPENVSVEDIQTLVAHDVRVCLGHSNASFEQTLSALDAGATGFTHLFNAMSGLDSREPNMVGAALYDAQSWYGLILDGHHVHPATAKVAYKAKSSGKMMLVSDAMSTIGSEQSAFEFDGHEITLVGDKLASKTGQLAGSALDMITAVNNAKSMLNISLEESLRMASLYPTQFLNSSQYGCLKVGNRANFTLISNEKNCPHKVTSTWIEGEHVFKAEA